jgi:pyruvate formate lyase activating enzyme
MRMKGHTSLRDVLADHTMFAAPQLFRRFEDGAVGCLACANRCRIPEGKTGICCVRSNRGGELRVPGGYVAGLNIDPIEKKPFFHVFPGRDALSFGMLGCNFHCPFCQNWISSQVLRDPESAGTPHPIRPEHLVDQAFERNVPVIVSTYNEPLITADWAARVFEKACEKRIVCGFVSNGNATPEVIEFLRPFMRLYKVDLKCFDDDKYRSLGGGLRNVLDSIALLKEKGFWVEVVTLLVPGFNDSDEQLRGIASFLAALSRDIPWHVTAFHPNYQMGDTRPTRPSDIERTVAFGREAGLRFIYSGNLPGSTGDLENTYCPSCKALLIQRRGYYILSNRMQGAHCPDCSALIPGLWEEKAPRAGGSSASLRRVL